MLLPRVQRGDTTWPPQPGQKKQCTVYLFQWNSHIWGPELPCMKRDQLRPPCLNKPRPHGITPSNTQRCSTWGPRCPPQVETLQMSQAPVWSHLLCWPSSCDPRHEGTHTQYPCGALSKFLIHRLCEQNKTVCNGKSNPSTAFPCHQVLIASQT